LRKALLFKKKPGVSKYCEKPEMARLLIALWWIFLPVFVESNTNLEFVLQAGTPVSVPNFIVPEAVCNWAGVAGQVFGPDGEPVSGFVVRVFGQLEGNPVDMFTFTGGAIQMGPGGFEIQLADHSISEQVSLNIQLMDVMGILLSKVYSFQIYPNCDQNLTLVNLVSVSGNFKLFFPWVLK
jgi:hypothetical protein